MCLSYLRAVAQIASKSGSSLTEPCKGRIGGLSPAGSLHAQRRRIVDSEPRSAARSQTRVVARPCERHQAGGGTRLSRRSEWWAVVAAHPEGEPHNRLHTPDEVAPDVEETIAATPAALRP